MLDLRRLGMAGKLKKINTPAEICIACFDNEATYTCIPCIHRVLCDICVKEYTKRYDCCPLCRTPFRNLSEKK